MKKCSKCNVTKPFDEFSKRKNSVDGMRHQCKKCRNKYNTGRKSYHYNSKLISTSLWRKTKDGVIIESYNHQKSNSKKRGHPSPDYSLLEFKKWMLNQEHFDQIYNNWVCSGFDRWSKPSVDRIDNNIHYTMGNIQLLTWKQNSGKR